VREKTDALKEFRFIVLADNAEEVHCADDLWIQGSPKWITLSIPREVLFGYSEKQYIPVYVSRSVGCDLASYSFELVYDPAVLSILHTSRIETLTEIGWVGPHVTPVSPGRVRIWDQTSGTPLHTEPGMLMKFYAEGIFHRVNGIDEFGYSELRIDTTTISLNFGDIDASAEAGSIYVTNECIEPLQAKSGFALSQNKPNPFNPETVIEFTLPTDGYAHLKVIDKMGRVVAEPVNGELKAGKHSVVFSATNLASGVYFYKLEAGRFSEMKKMILAR